MELQKPKIEILTSFLDDDPDYILLVDNILRKNGEHPYEVYSDVSLFMDSLKDGEKKICIIDYNLRASLTGLDLMKEIKVKSPNSYIIMISSQADIDVVTSFYDNDGFRYIPKHTPRFGERIIEAIEKAKTTVQRHLDFHFEMIRRFNNTKELIEHGRNTLGSNTVGIVS